MKIGYLITARLKSTRLKKKILLDLNGIAILDRVIKRCQQTEGVDQVVLCTSTNPQDAVLEEYALKNSIGFFKGSEDDVLQRLVDAAEFYGIDAFLSITADNPLHSYMVGQLIIKSYKKHDFDFIFTRGLPIGIAPYFLKTNALKVAIKMKSAADTEIWGPFVNRPDFFNIAYINIADSPFAEEKRLTCDYPEDFKLFEAVFNNFPQEEEPNIFKVFEALVKNPKIWDQNKSIKQLYNSSVQLAQINKKFDQQKAIGMAYAKEIGKKLNPGSSEFSIKIFYN